jgi:hypothetical protein
MSHSLPYRKQQIEPSLAILSRRDAGFRKAWQPVLASRTEPAQTEPECVDSGNGHAFGKGPDWKVLLPSRRRAASGEATTTPALCHESKAITSAALHLFFIPSLT